MSKTSSSDLLDHDLLDLRDLRDLLGLVPFDLLDLHDRGVHARRLGVTHGLSGLSPSWQRQSAKPKENDRI